MIKRLAIVFLVYLLLTIILTWPLTRDAQSHVINAGDPLFYAWNLMHNFHSVSAGLINILDTNIYYPTTNTLALSDTLATQTIFAYPIIWLTNNPILAINLYTLLTFPVAGLGMYLLMKSFVKHEWASVLSGAVFAFSIPRFGQMSHLPALSSQWFPYFFYGLYWFLQKGTLPYIWIASLSFVLLLGSTVYMGVFAVVVSMSMIGVFVLSWIKNQSFRSFAWARLKSSLLPFLLIAVLSLILMYPYIRLKAEHPEITRSLEESSARSAYQQDYYSVTQSSVLSGILKSNEGERSLYPTIALLILAGLGMSQWKKKTYRFPIILSGSIALVGLILSFGPARPFSFGPLDTGYITLPYAYLYKFFPLLQIIRVPARFSIVFMLGLSALAGFGTAHLASQKKWAPVLAGLTLLFLLEIWQNPMTLVGIPSYAKPPLVYQWVRQQQNVKAIIELPIGKIEEGRIPIHEQVTLPYERVTFMSPLVAETYRTYFAGFHGKNTVNGYSGYVPQSFHASVNAMKSFPDPSSVNYLRSQGVSHIIVHLWQLPPEQRNSYIVSQINASLKTVFATLDGDIVYEIIP